MTTGIGDIGLLETTSERLSHEATRIALALSDALLAGWIHGPTEPPFAKRVADFRTRLVTESASDGVPGPGFLFLYWFDARATHWKGQPVAAQGGHSGASPLRRLLASARAILEVTGHPERAPGSDDSHRAEDAILALAVVVANVHAESSVRVTE